MSLSTSFTPSGGLTITTCATSTQVRHALHNVVYIYSHIEHKELISNPTIATL